MNKLLLIKCLNDIVDVEKEFKLNIIHGEKKFHSIPYIFTSQLLIKILN
jgi:hypothetical protein